jgi:hypothetical protein
MQVEGCMREPRRTLEKKFEISQALCKVMDADPASIYAWADDFLDEHIFEGKDPPQWLLRLAAKGYKNDSGVPLTDTALKAAGIGWTPDEIRNRVWRDASYVFNKVV